MLKAVAFSVAEVLANAAVAFAVAKIALAQKADADANANIWANATKGEHIDKWLVYGLRWRVERLEAAHGIVHDQPYPSKLAHTRYPPEDDD